MNKIPQWTTGVVVLAALVLGGVAGCGDVMPPSVRPTTGPPAPPSQGPVSVTTAASVASLVGATSYFARTTGTTTQLYTLKDGSVKAHLRIPGGPGDVCVGNSVVVSPDGRRLAWVAGTSGTGRLTIATLDGATPRTLDDVFCLLDDRSWSSDSRTLTVNVERGDLRQTTLVNAATGAVEPAALGDGTIWSGNRAFQARRGNGHNTFTVSTAQGAVVHAITTYVNDSGSLPRCGFQLRGLSDDGRFVAIGECSTDPSRVPGASYLFDTVTGRHVPLPLSPVDHISFVDAGTVLVHSVAASGPALALMSVTGQVLESVPEPAQLRDALFLGCTLA